MIVQTYKSLVDGCLMEPCATNLKQMYCATCLLYPILFQYSYLHQVLVWVIFFLRFRRPICLYITIFAYVYLQYIKYIIYITILLSTRKSLIMKNEACLHKIRVNGLKGSIHEEWITLQRLKNTYLREDNQSENSSIPY